MKIKLIKPTMCAKDLHEMTYYPRPGYCPKPELPEGTVLMVEKEWSNFYGSYYRCETSEGEYDIPIENTRKF